MLRIHSKPEAAVGVLRMAAIGPSHALDHINVKTILFVAGVIAARAALVKLSLQVGFNLWPLSRHVMFLIRYFLVVILACDLLDKIAVASFVVEMQRSGCITLDLRELLLLIDVLLLVSGSHEKRLSVGL